MAAQHLFHELLNKLEQNWHGLPDKPDENPISTLCYLWSAVTYDNQMPIDDIMQLPKLDPEAAKLLNDLVDKRISGIPLAYLLGFQTYMGVRFLASPDAMIPRKETELLGLTAIGLAKQLANQQGVVQGLDLCTGSGNVVLVLAQYVPEYQAFAADISKNAIGLAKKNAKELCLEERVNFITGDLFEPFNKRKYAHSFDLITCNPPYIATANTEKMAVEISQYEPREAFNGGPFGVNLIMRLIREAPQYLKKSGWLVFEVGLGQGKSVQRLIEKTTQYQKIESRTGKTGQIRVLLAQAH